MNTITKENISKFAYTNEELLAGEPVAVLYEFHGLNDGISMNIPHSKLSYMCAEKGIIYCRPFYGPWSWMNRASINMMDELTEAFFDKYGKALAIGSSGLSMGGLAGLIYTRYAKYTPKVCAVICPVCDLLYHYDEREDTPRTLYSAYGGYGMPLKDALLTASPIHQAEEMPNIKYLILSTDKDDEVNYIKHSEAFITKMRSLGRDIEYILLPDHGHCDLTKEAAQSYREFLVNNL